MDQALFLGKCGFDLMIEWASHENTVTKERGSEKPEEKICTACE
jgi:hypothetical protein